MAQDELFQLVHSLSVSEQRYFRMHARQHSTDANQKYLRLFDALIEMETYDINELKERCAGENFLKHLPSSRRYLFQQLLKSLRNFHSERSIERRVRTLLDEVELLFERKLLRQCTKKLSQALQLARNHELPLHIFECLRWERRLIKAKREADFVAQIEAIEEEEKKMLAQLQQEQRYVEAHDREFLKMDLHEEVVPPRREDSFYSHLAYQSYRLYRARNQSNTFEAWEASRETIDHYRANPHQIEANPKRFINAFWNYIGGSINDNRSESILQNLQEIQEIPGLSSTSRDLLQPDLTLLEMLHHLQNENFDAVPPLKERLVKRIGQKNTHPNHLTFRYNIAIADFFLGDIRASKQEMEQLIHKTTLKLRPTLYHLARTWQLLLAILLEQDSILTYYTRSAKRFYRKSQDPQPHFNLMAVNMANKWPKLRPRERREAIREYLAMVEEYRGVGQGELREWGSRMLKRLTP